LGPVGLGTIINCISLGAKVIGVARNKYRAKLARELGASIILDPSDPNCIKQLSDLTSGLGADKSIECSGGKIYQRICIDGTRRKGQVAFVGESNELGVNISDDLIRKGLSVSGSWHWNLNDSKQMMNTIQNNIGLINKLITHRFSLNQVEEAFKVQISGTCGKVLLHPWE